METLSNSNASNAINNVEKPKGKIRLNADNFVSNQDSKEQVKDFYLQHLAPSSLQIESNEDQATEEMDTLDENDEVDPDWDGDYEADPAWDEDDEEDPAWDEDGEAPHAFDEDDDEVPHFFDEDSEVDPNELDQDDCKETDKVECEVAPASDDIEDE